MIKTNHGCGSVFIVKNKREVDLEKIRTQLKADLGSKFGKEMPRCIINPSDLL